jgi:hypothetical protein
VDGGFLRWADTRIDSSTPTNASELRKAPKEPTLAFTADVAIETAAAQLRVLGGPDTPIAQATNREVETLALTYVRGEGRTVVFSLPDLAPRLYALLSVPGRGTNEGPGP